MADIWTEGDAAAEYVQFLKALYHRTTVDRDTGEVSGGGGWGRALGEDCVVTVSDHVPL